MCVYACAFVCVVYRVCQCFVRVCMCVVCVVCVVYVVCASECFECVLSVCMCARGCVFATVSVCEGVYMFVLYVCFVLCMCANV